MLQRENGEVNSVDFLEEECLTFRKKTDQKPSRIV